MPDIFSSLFRPSFHSKSVDQQHQPIVLEGVRNAQIPASRESILSALKHKRADLRLQKGEIKQLIKSSASREDKHAQVDRKYFIKKVASQILEIAQKYVGKNDVNDLGNHDKIIKFVEDNYKMINRAASREKSDIVYSPPVPMFSFYGFLGQRDASIKVMVRDQEGTDIRLDMNPRLYLALYLATRCGQDEINPSNLADHKKFFDAFQYGTQNIIYKFLEEQGASFTLDGSFHIPQQIKRGQDIVWGRPGGTLEGGRTWNIDFNARAVRVADGVDVMPVRKTGR